MIIIFSFITIPAIVFPQYEEPEMIGKHKVNTSIYTFIDTDKVETFTNTGENRKLIVQFWFPEKTNEKFPLIVFSHLHLELR